MAMGHRRANGVGDERGLGQRAALVATRAQAPLLAGKGEEEFVAAIGAVQASETGMEIAAAEKRRDGCKAEGGRPLFVSYLDTILVVNVIFC